MNVLCMGMPFGTAQTASSLYASRRGHELRTLVAAGTEEIILDTSGTPPVSEPKYRFDPHETVVAVVERIARTWRPELLLCWQPEMFPPPRAIEECPIKTAAIVSDWSVYYGQLEHNLARYDIVLTDKLGSERLRAKAAQPEYFFPLYSHRTGVHRKLGIDRDLDVVFAGNLNHAVHAARGRCLESVAGLSDRYAVLVRSGVYGGEYTQLLNRARIVVNYALRREMNLRCFEALACGALLFIEDENLEAGEWLTDREEVVRYRPDTLVPLIEYYLSHPDEAARIAESGHARADTLAGENRFDALIDWIAAHPEGPRNFRAFSPELRAFADIMQYASSMVSGQRHLCTALIEGLPRAYANRPEFLEVAASDRLARARHLPEAERRSAIKQALEGFRRANLLEPGNAVWWWNLAFASRHVGAAAAEVRCLELALESAHAAWESLLLGDFTDCHYAAWRRDVAVGEARVELIHAAAAARLAEIKTGQNQPSEARELAQQSVAWAPTFAAPRRFWAMAEQRLGHPNEAVRVLEEGLPLTAFDADYRLELVHAYAAAGRNAEKQRLAAESARLFGAYHGAGYIAATFAGLAK